MFSAHSHYGQNLILSRYCLCKQLNPILGYMQHAYHDSFPFASFGEEYTRFYWKYIPMIVFNKRNADSLLSGVVHPLYNPMGVRPISPIFSIGAPFLYLMNMMNFKYKKNKLPRKTIAYPMHGNGVEDYLKHNERYAKDLLEMEGSNVTVCMHPRDWNMPHLCDLYKSFGFDVVRHGVSIDTSDFLYKSFTLLLQHDRIVSNSVGTAVFHGGLLGLEIGIYGTMTPDIAARNILIDESHAEEFLETYPALNSDCIMSTHAREISEHALGAEFVRDPNELKKILGWDRVGIIKSKVFLGCRELLRHKI